MDASTLTSESAVLRTSWSDEIERDVGGAADILVREGAVGPGVALAHHPLAHKVHSPHDKQGQDYPNDRANGTAVWLRLV